MMSNALESIRIAASLLPQLSHYPAWRFPPNGYSLSVDPNLANKVDKDFDIIYKSSKKLFDSSVTVMARHLEPRRL